MDAKRVVILSVAGIGNALLAVPMVRALKRERPAYRLTVYALTAAMGEVFRRQPEVDGVVVFQKGPRGRLRTIRALRRERFDVFLAPFPANRWQYALLAALSGARLRILHSYPVGGLRALAFLSATRVPARPGLHDVEQNLLLLEPLGIAPPLPEAPVFPLEDADRESAERLLVAAGLAGAQRPIVIHAGSAQTPIAAAKRWPTERFGRVVRELERRGLGPVLVVEGPDEAGVAARIEQASRPAAPAVVRLRGSLGDAAALLAHARLYFGSDSGLAHLAAAVGTPTVTLFAPTDPARVCPFGQRAGVLQPEGRTCSPCYAYPWRATSPRAACRPPYCIESVSVEAALARIEHILRAAGAESSAGASASR